MTDSTTPGSVIWNHIDSENAAESRPQPGHDTAGRPACTGPLPEGATWECTSSWHPAHLSLTGQADE